MAAFLNRDELRRHTCQVYNLDDLRRTIHRSARGARPILVATWHVGASGRPECAWHVETGLETADPHG